MKSNKDLVQEFMVIFVSVSMAILLQALGSELAAYQRNVPFSSQPQPIKDPMFCASILEIAGCIVLGFRYVHGNLHILADSYAEVETEASTWPFWASSMNALLQCILFGLACAVFLDQFSFHLILLGLFLVDILSVALLLLARQKRGRNGEGNATTDQTASAQGNVPVTNAPALFRIDSVLTSWVILNVLQAVAMAIALALRYWNPSEGKVPAGFVVGTTLLLCSFFDYGLNRKFYFGPKPHA